MQTDNSHNRFRLDTRAVARALGGNVARRDQVLAPGPGHSRQDRSLSVWIDQNAPDGFRVHSHAGDRWQICRDHVAHALDLPTWQHRHLSSIKPVLAKSQATNRPPADDMDNTELARWLWSLKQPPIDTPVEHYLREARGCSVPIPFSIGFLPARGKHLPAMIAGFGFAQEPAPGIVQLDDKQVRAVHITRLKADGSGKIEDDIAKLIIGRGAPGAPIVIAHPNDLLGLAITEGIEDGLSVFEATGLGVWAAGSASRMPPLAATVPDWIDCVTIVAHDDNAGLSGAEKLAAGLKSRGIHCEVKLLSMATP